ncbi:MAG: alpha/beta fold hydrolase [Candidatus Omnitrophica bacterium]|nr:alpha/beta fold hydrolase [Candidatus Omnitrophota bacterium]
MENNPHKYNFFYQGGNKAVLLIHGITGTPTEMHYLGRALHKAGFTVLCNVLPRHCTTLQELKKVTWQEITEACVKDLERLTRDYTTVFTAGLSMGALMAIHLAHVFPEKVKGIGALAPTFFYDGWAVPKKSILMPLLWHIPFIRNTMLIRESSPYGLKDEKLRKDIERFYTAARAREFDKKSLLFGSPFFPMSCLYQHRLFTKVVTKEMPGVKAPVIIFHAREDDMTSLKNARYVYTRIGSEKKELVILEDSYHMITIDKEKDKVAQEMATFFQGL